MPSRESKIASALRRVEVLRCIDDAGPDGLARRHVGRQVNATRDAISDTMSDLHMAGEIDCVGSGTAARWFTPRHSVVAAEAAKARFGVHSKQYRARLEAAKLNRVAIADLKSASETSVTRPPIHDQVPASIWRYAEMVGASS